jgi:hypothetical protein
MLKRLLMRNTKVKRLVEGAALLDQRRDDLIARYPELWKNLITGWNASETCDRGWMIYSANYLFRTNLVRWAIDPLTLNSRVTGAPRIDVAEDLKNLDFVLLTHAHKDHLDIDLLRALRHLPIQWIVPEASLPVVLDGGIPIQQILISKPAKPIELFGLRILPFKGLHDRRSVDGTIIEEVPATAYLVECDHKRWLFPGDTRNYEQNSNQELNDVDVLFAHLWLGKGAALFSDPPFLDGFCNFCLSFRPKRIVLTHLEEWGRQVQDFWTLEHATRVVTALKKLAPHIQIEIARTGDGFHLT